MITMTPTSRAIAWSAYLSAAVTVLGAMTLAAFFSLGQPFGTLNDALSAVGALLLLPLAWALYRRHAARASVLAALATLVGVAGMLTLASLQSLLVLDVVSFEQTLGAVFSASGAIGLWLVLHSGMAWTFGSLPRHLVGLGVAAGAGYVLSGLGFGLGQAHPVFIAGALLATIAYPLWAVGLGRWVTGHTWASLPGG